MILPLRRCLLALVGTLLVSASAVCAGTSWEALFPGSGAGTRSAAFPVGDGRYFIAVALSGMQAGEGRLRASGRDIPAEVFVDPVSRLVVFRISGPPEHALPLARSFGSRANAAVSVKGGGSAKSEAWIKAINGKMLPLALLKISYSGAVPQAGTPLVDVSGAVVAVAHQSVDGGSGYALPVEVVKRVLEDVQDKGKICRAWIGLKLRPEAKLPQVTSVQENSPANRAGIREGDVLLQVGPRPTADYADAVNAFFFLRPGVPVSVRLKRGDAELSLSLTPAEKLGG